MKNNIKFSLSLPLLFIAVFTITSCNKDFTKLAGPLTSLKDVKAYLEARHKIGFSSDRPLPLPVALEGGLGIMTDENSPWQQLLVIILRAGLFVNLDLSLCEMEPDRIFDPFNESKSGEDYIVSLILPNAAEKIQIKYYKPSPFYNFLLLKSISGEKIISIGGNTFTGMENLRSASFPSAEFIGSNAFAGCQSLVSVNIPKAVTIETQAFRRTKITEANFPQAQIIGTEAFDDCQSLKKVDLKNAQYIGDYAFFNCVSLSSVDLPQAANIGNSAFRVCENLKEISFPAYAKIGEALFLNCGSLNVFNLYDEGDLKVIEDGKALIRNNNNEIELIAYPCAEGEIEIKEITRIESFAFAGAGMLVSVSFPLVSAMGEDVFLWCYNLESVNFPLLKKISRSAFQEIESLKIAGFPSALTIGEHAFKNCVNLNDIDIPSVQYIESEAFAVDSGDSSDSPLNITFGNTAPNLGTSIFFGAKKIIHVLVPKGANGYGKVPAIYEGENNEQNWGNGLRGKGWDGHTGGYNVGAVNSDITINIIFIE